MIKIAFYSFSLLAWVTCFSHARDLPNFLKGEDVGEECGPIFIVPKDNGCIYINKDERCTYDIRSTTNQQLTRTKPSLQKVDLEQYEKLGEISLHPYKFRGKPYEERNMELLSNSLEIETSVEKNFQGLGIGTLARQCFNSLVFKQLAKKSQETPDIPYIISDVAYTNIASLQMNNKICSDFNNHFSNNGGGKCTKFAPNKTSFVYAYKFSPNAEDLKTNHQ